MDEFLGPFTRARAYFRNSRVEGREIRQATVPGEGRGCDWVKVSFRMSCSERPGEL